MHYPCPTAVDLANVYALNVDYLALAARHDELPGLARLSRREAERLARVPFLLFSLDVRNESLWQRLFDGTTDLVDAARRRDPNWDALVSSSIAFLWSLALTNPYAVRLFTGASADWCRQLGERRLVCITSRILKAGLRPTSRLASTGEDWRLMLTDATSPNQSRREATVLGLFQALNLGYESPPPLASAACRIPHREKTRR